MTTEPNTNPQNGSMSEPKRYREEIIASIRTIMIKDTAVRPYLNITKA